MSNPWRPVRARAADGGTYTTTPHLAAIQGDEILEDRPAVDEHGRWLPPTPKTNFEPARDSRGRFTTDEPDTGEEEA